MVMKTVLVESILSSNADEQAYHLFMLLEAIIIFLGNAIHKQWHTWIGRRTGGDKVIAGTSGDASRGWEEEKDNVNGVAGDVEAEQSWELSFN